MTCSPQRPLQEMQMLLINVMNKCPNNEESIKNLTKKDIRPKPRFNINECASMTTVVNNTQYIGNFNVTAVVVNPSPIYASSPTQYGNL
jgi:hypothetical protein